MAIEPSLAAPAILAGVQTRRHELQIPRTDERLSHGARHSHSCGVGTRGTACPSGAIGLCNLSSVGANPAGYVQYHYTSSAIANATASQDLCTLGGGAWSAP